MAAVAPYGAWKSPISSAALVEQTVRLSDVQADATSGRVFWAELRPGEGGRVAVCSADLAAPAAPPVTWTPTGYNVRSTVHEYGGVSFLPHPAGGLVFVNFADQQLYRQAEPDAPPVRVTEGDKSRRFIAPVADPARNRVLCVHEDHTQPGECRNAIVSVDLATGAVATVVHGADFYSAPSISTDGAALAWVEWMHPNMPWDNTALKVARLTPDGTAVVPGTEQTVAGGPAADESLVHPVWDRQGRLLFLSDRTDWWNLYRAAWAHGPAAAPTVEPIFLRASELCDPHWVFQRAPFAFLDAAETRLALSYGDGAELVLATLDLSTGALARVSTGFTNHRGLAAVPAANTLAVLAGSPAKPSAVVAVPLAASPALPAPAPRVLQVARPATIDDDYVSVPRSIEFPTAHGRTAFGYFYAPRNRDYVGPADARPPLLVKVHGGPTAACSSNFNAVIQYWTSRGFAILDVNYGGSTGYGRRYRQRLNGQWGVVDVDDCVNGALYLARTAREVDEARLAIDGGSAGGFTTLAVLAFRDAFKAGCSNYGVTDLERLALDTHKFEARYLDTLVGPYPASRDVYLARSPIHHLEGLNCPTILFQGDEDKIVPPSQAEMMFEALKAKGLPVAYVLFPGEQHGFRKAENIRANVDGEFAFFCQMFGIVPADQADLPVLKIENWTGRSAL